MKKYVLLFFSVIIVSFLFIKFALPNLNISSITKNSIFEKPFTFKANIQYIKGNAWTVVEDRKTELKENDILDEGATIITDSEAYLVLSLDDGSVIRVGPSTEIVLTSLISNDVLVENRKGSVFSRVYKDKNHLYTVIAGNISVSAKGTVFFVENDEDVKVSVFESAVVVNQPKGTQVEVTENNKWEKNSSNLSKITEDDIQKDTFIAWSLEEEKVEAKLATTQIVDKKVEPKVKTEVKQQAKEEIKEKIVVEPSISLKGKSKDNGIYLEWKVNGFNVDGGFKIVRSSSKNPTFPENGYVYVQDSEARHYTVSVTDGKTWNFRICHYSGGKCSLYSNNIEVKAFSKEEASDKNYKVVKSINLEINKKAEDKIKLVWESDGYPERGYKILYSKNENPTYPLRKDDKYIYNKDPSVLYATVTELSGKYYFRVCEYLGGKCGVYSNQVWAEF